MNRLQLDAMLRLVDVQINPAVFKKISQATATLPKNLQVTINNTRNLNTHVRQLNNSANQTASSFSNMNKFAKSFLQRMAQFAVLLPAFATLNRAIQGGVAFMARFESELVKVVRTDPSKLAGRMREIGDSVLDIAVNFGSTGDAVLETTKTFVQAGDSIEEALDKARVATLATQVSTLDLVGAQELLLTVSKQFADQGLSNIEILEKVAKAEDLSATNAQDLTDAFRTGGNALAFASKSFEDTIGLVSALREQTRKSGREIGTFFKTLATRAFAEGESKTAIESLGVAVENVDGSLRPLLPVLIDLKAKFEGLSEAEQASASKAIAGVRQFEALLGVLNSLERAAEISGQVQDASGTATQRLALVQETLAFKVNQTIASFQKLAEASGDNGALDIFKQLVDFAGNIAFALEGAVKFADKLGVSLAPLLAVGGLKLGQKIFGINGGLPGAGKQSSGQAGGGVIGNAAAQTAKGYQVIGVSAQKTAKIQAIAATKSSAALAAMIVSAGLVSSGFDLLSDEIAKSEGTVNKFRSSMVSGFSDAINTGASFALLGAKAALVAGTLSLAVSTINSIVVAMRDEETAIKELREINKQGSSFNALQKNAGGSLDELVDIFANQLGASNGKITGEFFAAVEKDFASFAKGIPELQDIDPKSIFDTKIITAIASARPEFEGLRKAIDEGGVSTSLLKQLLMDIDPEIQATKTSFSDLEDELTSLNTAFSTLSDFQTLIDLEKEIGENRAKLNEITGQSITLFESEASARQKELAAMQDALDTSSIFLNELKNAARSSPFEAGFATSAQSEKFVSDVQAIFEETGRSVQGTLSRILTNTDLDEKTRSFGVKLVTALGQQLDSQLELEQAAFEVRKAMAKEEFDRQNVIRDAARATDDVLRDLSGQLLDLGLSADASLEDLQALQNLGLEDFKSILAGTSDLGKSIQDAVQAAAGGDVSGIEAEIAATSAKGAMELEALRAQLDETVKSLSNMKDGFDQLTGKSEVDLLTQAADLRNKITQRQGQIDIDLAKLGLDRAKALKSAEDDAIEKTKKLNEALKELSDAEAKVAEKTYEINRSFDEFIKSKVDEFSSADADAQGQLKDAQQAVLESTEALSDAYKDLNAAILDFNDGMAEAQVESNLLGVQIDQMAGGLSTFNGRLNALSNAFNTVLNDANISIQKRIELERQLAEETLSFLQQAQAEITSAGLEVFGQSGEENRSLQEGVAGLEFIADKLGGSFEDFLKINPGDFNKLSNQLLNLPQDFRQKMLDALNTLPSTVNVGGFSVEELKTAIGQIGAGVAPEEGLPSVEELITKETDQIMKLQELAIQDATLQITAVAAAQEQVELAKTQLEEDQIMAERAEENVIAVRDAILTENAVLEAANEQRQILTEQVLAATTDAALQQIQSEAQQFAEQNSVFREIGDQIVTSINSLASVQAAALAAAANVPAAFGGHIPNYAKGNSNLSRSEAFGLLRAASREKRHMPAGAGLAVANTSETIIPARHRGQNIPNFADGNLSPIAAGISAAKGINETVVAAISRSIGNALADITKSDGALGDTNRQMVEQLSKIRDELSTLNTTSNAISTNTAAQTGGTGAGATNVAGKTQADLRIEINTNQRDTVQVTGIDSLASELESAMRRGKDRQVEEATAGINEAVGSIVQVLRDRGLISSLGQGG